MKCRGIAIGDGNFSGCGGESDCPVCFGTGQEPDPTPAVNGVIESRKVKRSPTANAGRKVSGRLVQNEEDAK